MTDLIISWRSNVIPAVWELLGKSVHSLSSAWPCPQEALQSAGETTDADQLLWKQMDRVRNDGEACLQEELTDMQWLPSSGRERHLLLYKLLHPRKCIVNVKNRTWTQVWDCAEFLTLNLSSNYKTSIAETTEMGRRLTQQVSEEVVVYEDCGNFQTAAAPQVDHLIQKIEKDKIINTNRFHSFISYLLKLSANSRPPLT